MNEATLVPFMNFERSAQSAVFISVLLRSQMSDHTFSFSVHQEVSTNYI